MLPLIINEKYNNPIDKKIKVFKTRDSISEFMDTALRNTFNDMNIAFHKSAGQMLASGDHKHTDHEHGATVVQPLL